MRIVVMGAGGVGGYYGARLAQAEHDVAFVARGRLLSALLPQQTELSETAPAGQSFPDR
jgi:2-dehydropantoate 2-reductase